MLNSSCFRQPTSQKIEKSATNNVKNLWALLKFASGKTSKSRGPKRSVKILNKRDKKNEKGNVRRYIDYINVYGEENAQNKGQDKDGKQRKQVEKRKAVFVFEPTKTMPEINKIC